MDSSHTVLEVIRGQIDNVHSMTEQLMLSRIGLLNDVTFARTNITPKWRPTPKGKKKKERPVKNTPKTWRLNETRAISIPMSVTCVDVQKQTFAIEELTQLASIALSLKNSCDVLIGSVTPPIPEE